MSVGAFRVACTGACLAMVASCAGSVERATFQIPGSSAAVSIERRSTRGVLAEYRRRVILECGNQSPRRLDLFPDSGEYARVKLFKEDERKALLRDVDARHTIDLGTCAVSKDEGQRRAGTFIGSFDVDESDAWRFISAQERRELPTEFRSGP